MRYLMQGHVVLNEPNEPLPIKEEFEACDEKDALWQVQSRANELYAQHNKKCSRKRAITVYLQAMRYLRPVIANAETDTFCKWQAHQLEKRGMSREKAKSKAERTLLMTR